MSSRYDMGERIKLPGNLTHQQAAIEIGNGCDPLQARVSEPRILWPGRRTRDHHGWIAAAILAVMIVLMVPQLDAAPAPHCVPTVVR